MPPLLQSSRPSFPQSFLTTTLAAFLFFILVLTALFATDGFRPLLPLLWLSIAVTLFFAFFCLIILPFRKTSPPERAYISLTALTCILAIAIPYFLAQSQRREIHSPASYTMRNLRGIAHSCAIYAADNNEHFPPHLALLILRGHLAPRKLVSSADKTTPYILPDPIPPETDWLKIAPEVDAHCDFIYTGADLTNPNDPEIILAYTRPLPSIPEGRIVAYSDGHTFFERGVGLKEAFEKSNAARAKLHLPPFNLDDSPPTASNLTPTSTQP